MDKLNQAVTRFREGCTIYQDSYFDLAHHPMIETGQFDLEQIEYQDDKRQLVLLTRDGYKIQIVKMDMYIFRPTCWFNGYVTIPSSSFILHDIIQENPGYDDFQYFMKLRHAELTYGNGIDTFGWDHGHTHDFNFYQSPVSQTDRLISGPVQILNEAMEMIGILRTFEHQALLKKKKEWMSKIKEELIQKSMHPKRVEFWIEAGMDV